MNNVNKMLMYVLSLINHKHTAQAPPCARGRDLRRGGRCSIKALVCAGAGGDRRHRDGLGEEQPQPPKELFLEKVFGKLYKQGMLPIKVTIFEKVGQNEELVAALSQFQFSTTNASPTSVDVESLEVAQNPRKRENKLPAGSKQPRKKRKTTQE